MTTLLSIHKKLLIVVNDKMLLIFLVFLLSITYVKVTGKLILLVNIHVVNIVLTGCPGNYQYYRQPPTNFTHCNPARTSLLLRCTVFVPHDSTTVTVDWYWSKNINECGRNITKKKGRLNIISSRKTYITKVDRIITDLTIMSPQNDTGYYWCQVNDPSYNGVFISGNKAPVFDTGTMTNCDDVILPTTKSNCAVGSVPPSLCVIPTKTTIFSPTTSYELNNVTTTVIPVLITSITNMNVPKPTSQILKRIEVTSTVRISSNSNSHTLRSTTLNSVVISPTLALQETSSNIIVISTIVAVFVLLILLILLIMTIIIIIVITKKKTNSGK